MTYVLLYISEVSLLISEGFLQWWEKERRTQNGAFTWALGEPWTEEISGCLGLILDRMRNPAVTLCQRGEWKHGMKDKAECSHLDHSFLQKQTNKNVQGFVWFSREDVNHRALRLHSMLEGKQDPQKIQRSQTSHPFSSKRNILSNFHWTEMKRFAGKQSPKLSTPMPVPLSPPWPLLRRSSVFIPRGPSSCLSLGIFPDPLVISALLCTFDLIPCTDPWTGNPLNT